MKWIKQNHRCHRRRRRRISKQVPESLSSAARANTALQFVRKGIFILFLSTLPFAPSPSLSCTLFAENTQSVRVFMHGMALLWVISPSSIHKSVSHQCVLIKMPRKMANWMLERAGERVELFSVGKQSFYCHRFRPHEPMGASVNNVAPRFTAPAPVSHFPLIGAWEMPLISSQRARTGKMAAKCGRLQLHVQFVQPATKW